MNAAREWFASALGLAVLLVVAATPGLAATLSTKIDPPTPNAGDPITLTLTVQGGTLGKVVLPEIDGVDVQTDTQTSKTFSYAAGVLTTTTAESFHLVPKRTGDFTLPAFDVPLQEGGTLHSGEVKFHVQDGDSAAATNAAATNAAATNAAPMSSPPAIVPAGPTNLVVAPAGPVILPPVNPPAPGQAAPANATNPDDGTGSVISVPRDKDGGPAKVFMLISPETTDAYVGQLVPLRIDFYIRMEVNADQNSLPTIKGSDFLMNNISIRGHDSLIVIENEQYLCETWLTAISAPKSGDFPLASERDTYWVKSVSNSGFDPYGFSRHADLAHEVITSNQNTIHVHPLPPEGRPDHFTGAIGQFQVTGDAQPATVTMGEPVTLYYSVAGVGNFDYVRCPALADDPNWKTYVPASRITFKNESRTEAIKTFEQSVIPLKNGNVLLPAATFSYFDPATKQYVTVPIALPSIAVTGAMPAAAAPPAVSEGGSASTGVAPAADELLPNRAELGSLEMSMIPAYNQPWFWLVQGGLVGLPLLGLLLFFLRRRRQAGQESAESVSRRNSVRQEEDAMAEAARQGNALAFFIAARHALQLRLGAQWAMQPEAITLGEVRRRDPQLAESLAPLFAQADEVIYSGRASANLDLAQWEAVARELLRLQPA